MKSWCSVSGASAGKYVCAAMLWALAALGEAPKLPPLTTVSSASRLAGKFVWADLATDDVGAARTFYSKLFGWTFMQFGDYLIAANQERPLCGMFQRPRPANRPEAKPRWLGYISVASVARAQRAVTNGGGQVLMAPQSFANRGEQAVFADPEGTIFGVIKSSSGDPEDFLPEAGDWIWIQLLSRNGRNAAEFYRAVGGYKVIENTTGNRLSDYVLESKGYARATVRTIPSSHPEVQPNWLPFVRVENITEAVSKAERLGGKALIAPKPAVFEGKLAVIADPTGAAIGLLEWRKGPQKGGI